MKLYGDTDNFRLMTYPAEVLREQCMPVARVARTEAGILRRMFDVMRFFKGIGLAAPQVGIPRRLVVAAVESDMLLLANPEIVARDGADVMTEGCLSVPGAQVMVSRSQELVVRGMDEKGKRVEYALYGLMARVVQHEIDHLDGKLIIDYLPPGERQKYGSSGR
jgi:peptide deformylase